MQLKTILNHAQKQPGFVYESVRLVKGAGRAEIEVGLRSRVGTRPLWGLAVFFVYVMRRVDCLRCGVRVEAVPWAEGKNQLTTTYA